MRYFIIYKPYKVLSQFSPHEGKDTLADHFSVPKNVYPVGRLDYDSEGLLLLTNDAVINTRLLNPRHKHEREYWVQVEGSVTAEAIQELGSGLTIFIDGKEHHTLPAKVSVLTNPGVPERHPPIRFRQHIPTAWISLSLTEGKNRQVRRMTAKVNLPTLRLIRVRIEKLAFEELIPGYIKELTRQEVYDKLFNKLH